MATHRGASSSSPNSMKRLVLFAIALVTASTVPAQISGRGDSWREARFNIKLGDIDRAVEYYSTAVAQAIARRNSGRGVCGELMAEYAYALALNHDYELSLMYIDRARTVGARHADFYTGQILAILGYSETAQTLTGRPPEWLDGIWQNRLREHSEKARLLAESPNDALQHAIKLSENGQHIQAMTLYEELLAKYPAEPMVAVAYSTLWESIGKPEQAARMLKRGIELTDKGDTSRRHIYEQHLDELSHASSVSWGRFFRTIVYVGASTGKEMLGINGRLGISTESKLSLSLTGNYSSWGGNPVSSVGLSVYKSWSWFVLGMGTSCQWIENKATWGLSPSLGVAIFNLAGNSSVDITLGAIIPFSNEDTFGYSLSIGRTVYLDFNKKGRIQ